jgi:hypothetical protein
MFGLFKKVVIDHSVFGPLTRRGREWDGTIKIMPNKQVSLALEGTKEAPHPATLTTALELPGKLPGLIPIIANELMEHLEPYREAIIDSSTGFADAFSDAKIIEKILKISSADDAWAASEICGVEVGLASGKVRLLIKIQSIWDEEHVLGAYFDDWQFMGLNGSV